MVHVAQYKFIRWRDVWLVDMTSILRNWSNILNFITEGMYRVSNHKLAKPNLA